MRTIAKVLTVVLSSCICMPLAANAVSWSPLQEKQTEKTAKGIREKGAIVCLFQSGTADVKKEIRFNDILIVCREDRDHRLHEVGKIRILSYVEEDYLNI